MTFNCPKISLRKNASGSSVRELQESLQKLGYYNGKIDASFGPVTEQAVKSFQTRYGLKADGWFGEITCNKLNSILSTTTSSSSEVFDCDNTHLKRNSTEKDKVTILQKYLKEWEYYNRTVDGDFGYYTEEAVKAFQRDTGHDPDGYFGPKTCPDFVKKVKGQLDEPTTPPYVLGSKINETPLFARYLSGKLTMYPEIVVVEEVEVEVENVTTTEDTSTSTDTSSEDESESTDTTTSEPTTTTATITRYRIKELGTGNITDGGGIDCNSGIYLKNGSSGADVKILQTGLSKMGYYTNTIDGEFGPKTAEAVKALQRNVGITVDGEFGSQTCPYFNQKLGINATSKAVHKEYYILTDLINPQPNSDNEGLTHDCTLRTPYTQEKLLKIQNMQRCYLELTQDVDTVYKLDGYVSELKIVQENNAFFIEMNITGFSAFLEQDFADYKGNKKQSEHLQDICKEIGLLLKLELNGLSDESIEINKVTVNNGSGNTSGTGGSGRTVQMSNTDCNPNNRTESDTWADHRCNPPRCTAKSKVAHGNSSRSYATDTASHNSTVKELVEFVEAKCQYQKYGDNIKGSARCPEAMWNAGKSGKIVGNCADFARMMKCIFDVNGYNSIICHIPGHFYNAVWENGGWTLVDICAKTCWGIPSYGHANHGNVKPTGTWDNPQPRLWY